MTALDDAIARHATHGAASGFDPLTDSLGDQQLGYGPGPVHLRAGWENEPIEVRFPRWALALALVVSIVGSCLLTGCGGGNADDDDDRKTTGPVDCRATPERCR